MKKTMLQVGKNAITATELMDALPELYFASEPGGKIVYLGKRWNELFGLNIENYNKTVYEIVHADDVGETMQTMGSAFEYHKKCEFEYRLHLKSGQYHWYYVVMAPVFRESELIAWFGHAVDIDSQKRMFQSLQENEKRKDEFIGMASHELKTPITSAKMILQIVQKQLKGTNDGNAIPLLDKAEVQINRLTRLTNDLLDVSKIKAGRLTLIKEVVNFDPFFCDTVLSLPVNGHKVDVKSNTKCKIVLDKGRFVQVMTNLINNAIKYSPDAKKIIVRAETDGLKIIVSVQDFGIGIPIDKQTSVFDRFYRVEEQVAETFSGLGLGLYITSEIVHLHGGRIWLESKVNSGSTFYFTLPR